MMPARREIAPILHPLNAAVSVPGSKSITNRALLLASLADGHTSLTNALFSDDSRHFAAALRTLGIDVQLEPTRCAIGVTGRGGTIPADKAALFVGNAGTAARFLTAFLTLGHGEYLLDGDARMRERPIGDLVSALRQLGAQVEAAAGCPPVRITGCGLPGGRGELPGNISSQFLSALLMVAPYASQPVEIELSTELASKPYVDLTLSVMRAFGVHAERAGYERFAVRGGRYQPREMYAIEPDATAASYFFAAAAICRGSVRVKGLTRSSAQGDIGFVELLAEMGCTVTEGTDHLEVTGNGSLRGVDVDLSDRPDTAQTLAVIAPFAATATRIRGIGSARLKETDRVHGTCAELRRLGVSVEEHNDGMLIHPAGALQPALIQTYHDHRMAMAFSLIGLRVPGIQIEDPACVSKTFPRYFDVLESLR